ncbi:thioredoxin family protein [Lysobacter solisilvae (ex Woo and Kim 2020)]|uniref:Thioredoxin family protein n=1 Tax=Agrilutibacter terrestris TaxID=2865112 RepID=A0A7H0FXL3_9GAMM|nr:thioredoxin family protein [Lysobacter terrestris]QNP40779.1 thioredoxin family protein [Lysobacter terrestris]
MIKQISAALLACLAATSCMADNQQEPILPNKASSSSPPMAPEFTGINHWINSPPLTMQSLRGKVVLVEFWTYDCINCIHVIPHVRQLHERYAPQGLVVVGVHTPEFGHERVLANVRGAVQRYGIRYPVAQDNSYKTWNAYGNRYWPAQYLIDRQGRVVYSHFGEGGYEQTEARVRALLRE